MHIYFKTSSCFWWLALALVADLTIVAALARAGLPEFASLAEKAGSAVVNISSEVTQKSTLGGRSNRGKRGNIMPFPHGQNPFEDFFEQFEDFFGHGDQPGLQRKRSSLGSGFLISTDGYIFTNNHVVEKADKILVKLQDSKKTYPAKLIGQDKETDLALIKIEADKNLPALSLADSSRIKVGEWVVAIGNPFGLSHTVTVGIVSAKGRIIGSGPYDDFIQTDASINPGNSGGPLLNLDGEVIGVNAAIVASGQGIGFAIPSNIVKDVVVQLKSSKGVRRGLLGVNIQDVDESIAKALGLKEPKGALIASVMADGAAKRAGIEPGDIITMVNGKTVEDAHDLTRRIGAMAPSDSVEIVLFRKGQTKTLIVKLDERDPKKLKAEDEFSFDGDNNGDGDMVLGLLLRPLDKDEARNLGIEGDKGLLVLNIDASSVAAEAGLRKGDIILTVNQRPVATVDELRMIVDKEGKQNKVIMFLTRRQGQNLFRTIPVE
ncbi:putative periplasmic serine endoprotease DegP-like [Desulfovibrionales bacterium]